MSDMTKRMMRVGASGVIATAVDVAMLVLLVELAGVYVTAAAFLAAATGGVTNFTLNKYWSFQDPSPIDLRQVSSYAFVAVLTAAFVAASVHLFAVIMGLPYLVAKAAAATLVFLLWSYPAQAKLVFPAAAAVPRRPV